MSGVFQHSYQKREAKIAKSFCSRIINLLFDGFTYTNCVDILEDLRHNLHKMQPGSSQIEIIIIVSSTVGCLEDG